MYNDSYVTTLYLIMWFFVFTSIIFGYSKSALSVFSLFLIYIIDYSIADSVYNLLPASKDYYIYLYFIGIYAFIAIVNGIVLRKNSVASLCINLLLILLYSVNITMCINNNYKLWEWFYSVDFHYYVAISHLISSFELNLKENYDRISNFVRDNIRSCMDNNIFAVTYNWFNSTIKEGK